MEKYLIKVNIDIEVEAFNESDAKEYALDVLNIDNEIKHIDILKIKKVK
jgi:hypothetical protein